MNIARPVEAHPRAATPVDSRTDVEYDLGPAPEAALPLPLPIWRRVSNHDAVRRTLVLLAFALAWELGARWADNDLMLPTFVQTLHAFVDGVVSGELLVKAGISLSVLLKGYVLGVACAFALTCVAISTRWGRDILATLTAMLNPLPPVALLPLSLLWFGLGQGSLVFVLVHSVVWPLTLSTVTGFEAVPETLRMAGRNYGLTGLRYVFQILVPAALPSIVSGLKIGWAFAWRTLIAAELVFGASSGKGGLGWYIFQNRNELQTDRVFAGLIMVTTIGLLVEVVFFRTVERLTVQRWGMQRSS